MGNKLLPTVAFDLLTETTQQFAKIQCALFKGTDRTVFIDKREFGGPIFEQIDDAYNFVLKHINLGAEIHGLYREESYELPPEAIREAIANAVTHRNYMDNACVQVFIYDNRVEITSPGMLFGGLTIEMIKNGRTRIRNTTIAEIFSRMYVIEGWGTGIRRIINLCKDYGLKEPEFCEIGNDFRVNFFRNETVNDTVKIAPALRSKYPEIDILLNNPSMSIDKLAHQLGCSRSTICRHIKELKELGILTREGTDKSGNWKIK